MVIYEFRLRFKVPKIADMTLHDVALMDSESLDDAFYGIDDEGLLEIEFDREANSADQAIFGAINDVCSTIEKARFLEAHPDMVGLSDMAAHLRFSRQNMRKFSLKKGFPDPIHQGKSPIWHFCTVVAWLENKTNVEVPDLLSEISIAAMNANQKKRTETLSAIIPEIEREAIQKFPEQTTQPWNPVPDPLIGRFNIFKTEQSGIIH